jgi:tetratricopeptide (TPR) repeat protein
MAKRFALGAALLGLILFLSFVAPGRPGAADDKGQIEQLLANGNELAQKGDYDGALTTYKKILALDEKNALAHNNLGIIYKRKGLYILAVEEFQAALECLPEYFKAYNNLANVYYERGYYDEAVKYYNKALGVKPNFADAHWNLALAYEKKGDAPRAIAHYRKYAELSDSAAFVALAQQHIDALSAPPGESEDKTGETQPQPNPEVPSATP